MNLHKHARLTPRGRALLVQHMLDGLRAEEAAQAAGVSVRTTYKWLRRFREEGEAGLMDRSSRPHSCPHATATTLLEQLIALRRSRKTYRQIAQILGLAVSTVARRLKQAGFHRLAELEPAAVGVLPHFHGRFEKGRKLQILPGDSTTHSWVMKPLDVVE